MKKATAKFLTSMTIFGTIGLFVDAIPLNSGAIALFRGVMGLAFLLLVMALTKQKLRFDVIKRDLLLLWCFAEGRKAGDTGVVLSDFGYHIMYFVGHAEQTYREYMITNVMKSDDMDKWAKEIYDAVKYEVLDISRLQLDLTLAPNAF